MEEEDLVRMRNTDQPSSSSSNPSSSLPSSPCPPSKLPGPCDVHEHPNGGSAGGAGLIALMLGLLPSALNAMFGSSQAWTEFCVFAMVSIWIYYSLRVPWDLFLAASRENDLMTVRERFYLFMAFVAPLTGAFGLWTLKSYFAEGLLLCKLNIPLFLIGAFLRPVMHLLSAVERHDKRLGDSSDKLARRIEALEHELTLMKHAEASVPLEPASPQMPALSKMDSVLQQKLLQLDKRMLGMEAVIRKKLYSTSGRPQPKSLVLRLLYPALLFFGWPFLAVKKLLIG